MSRSAIFAVIAVVLAGGAAAVWVLTGGFGSTFTAPATAPAQAVSDQTDELSKQVRKIMSDAVATGGVALTFQTAGGAKWQVSPGHKLERFALGGGDTVVARLSSSNPLDDQTVDWQSQGLSATLSADLSNQIAGRKIEIGIIAKAAQTSPGKAMYSVYATQQFGNSGWRELPVGAEFQLHSYVYNAPAAPEGGYTNAPILVIHASNGHSVELIGAYIKVVGE